MKFCTVLIAFCISIAICSVALAHPHHPVPNSVGLASGFSHPWLGIDHLLAMIAVGLLSVQVGGRALWVLPTSFLGMMILGGAIGMTGLEIHAIEFGIALSVVALGAALAIGKKYHLVASAIVIGTLGLLHGNAHGTEMQAMASPMLYATGFILATTLLHLTGIMGGLMVNRSNRLAFGLRLSGAAISCAGLLLLIKAS
jgi:urease accessory protein